MIRNFKFLIKNPRGQTYVCLFFVLLIASIEIRNNISTPLNFDEVEITAAAKAYQDTGRTLYQLGMPVPAEVEKNPWIFQGPQKNYQSGLWHSSYIVPLLALSYRVFGLTDWSSRIPGLLCWFLSWLCLLCLIESFDLDFKVFFSIVYFSLPTLFQQGIMVDLDNTIGSLGLCLSSLLFFRLQAAKDHKKIFLIQALIVVLLAWSKETMPLYWTLALFSWLLIQRKFQNLFAAFLGTLAGVVLFWISWSGWSKAVGMAPDYFIHFNYLRRVENAVGLGDALSIIRSNGVGAYLQGVFRAVSQSLISFDVSFWILLLSGILLQIKKYKKKPVETFIALLMFWIFFLSKIARPDLVSFKYEYPLYPLAAWLISALLFSRFSPRHLVKLFLLALPIALLRVFLVGDPLMVLFGSHYNNISILQILAVSVIILVLTGIGVRKLFNGNKAAKTQILIFACLCSLFAFNISQAFFQDGKYETAVNANGSYGDSGLAETAELVRHMVEAQPTTLVVCRKDIGFHAFHMHKDDSHLWYGLWELANPTFLAKLEKEPHAIVVADKFSIEILARLGRNVGLFPIYQSGPFVLFSKKP